MSKIKLIIPFDVSNRGPRPRIAEYADGGNAIVFCHCHHAACSADCVDNVNWFRRRDPSGAKSWREK